MPDKLNIAVFASGRGSNFQAISDAISRGNIPNAQIAVVLSNNSQAGALKLARERNIAAIHLSRQQFSSDEDFNRMLLQVLTSHDVNFIVLAGYMKKLDSVIIDSFKNRIINIHPALLPAYGGKGMYGMHVHEAVLAAGEKQSGASVHIVDSEYDRGPVVMQRAIDVAPGETPETLAHKVLKIEHELYPHVVRLFAEGRIQIAGNRVAIMETA